MPRLKKKSHTDTSGPPAGRAGSMPVVNKHRDERNRPTTRRKRDEGRFKRPDCAALKSGRRPLNVATWNVRTLNQLGKMENLQREAES